MFPFILPTERRDWIFKQNKICRIKPEVSPEANYFENSLL